MPRTREEPLALHQGVVNAIAVREHVSRAARYAQLRPLRAAPGQRRPCEGEEGAAGAEQQQQRRRRLGCAHPAATVGGAAFRGRRRRAAGQRRRASSAERKCSAPRPVVVFSALNVDDKKKQCACLLPRPGHGKHDPERKAGRGGREPRGLAQSAAAVFDGALHRRRRRSARDVRTRRTDRQQGRKKKTKENKHTCGGRPLQQAAPHRVLPGAGKREREKKRGRRRSRRGERVWGGVQQRQRRSRRGEGEERGVRPRPLPFPHRERERERGEAQGVRSSQGLAQTTLPPCGESAAGQGGGGRRRARKTATAAEPFVMRLPPPRLLSRPLSPGGSSECASAAMEEHSAYLRHSRGSEGAREREREREQRRNRWKMAPTRDLSLNTLTHRSPLPLCAFPFVSILRLGNVGRGLGRGVQTHIAGSG